MDKFEMLLNKMDRYPVQRWELLVKDTMTVIEFEAEEVTDCIERCRMAIEYSLLRRFMSCDFTDESVAKAAREVIKIVSFGDYSDVNIDIICSWFKSAIDRTLIEFTLKRYVDLVNREVPVTPRQKININVLNNREAD